MNFPFDQDPKFAKLSYESQQRLRLEYASTQFGKDQRFLNLPEDSKLALLQDIQMLPPVFENPDVGAQFQEASKNPVLFQTFANANKQLGLLGVVAGMMKNITPNAAVTHDMLYGSDASKGAAWIQGLIDSNESLSPIAKMLPTLGSIVGFVTDLASYATATHLGPTRALAGGLAEVGARAQTQLARWAISDFAPHAARMAGQGLTGILREKVILPAVNGTSTDTSIASIAKTFGTYAAGDTLFWNAVAWGGPFLKLAGKTVASIGRSQRSISGLLYTVNEAGKKVPFTAEDMQKYEVAQNRGDLPNELLQTASPAVQDHFQARGDAQFYAAHPEIAQRDPFGKTVLAARSIGLDVVKDEIGGFRVRHVTDPGVVVHVDTLGKLDESLVQYLRDRKGLFNLDELRADPLRGHLVRMMDAQDGISDALKVKPEGAKPSYVPIDSRPTMSPIEAENIKAGAFVGAGQTSVADTFRIPISEATLAKVAKEKTLLPKGSDAIPLTKEGGTPNVFVIAGKVAPVSEFESATKWAARAADAGSKEPQPQLVATALRRAGYDGVNLPDGSFLALYPERQIKILDNTLSPTTGRKGFKAPSGVKMENASISIASMKGSVPDTLVQGNNALLGTLLRDGKNTNNIARGASLLLKRLNAKDSRVNVSILNDATEITVRKTSQGVRVFLPPDVKNLPSELANKLADHVAADGSASRKIKPIEAQAVLPEDVIAKQNLTKWFANLIEGDPVTRGWIAKNAAGLEPIEAIKKFALSEMTPQVLKTTMSKFGVRIIGSEGNLKAMKGGKIIASGRTGSELLASAGIELDKIPSKFAPKVVGLSPDAVEFEVTGISVRGGPKQIWKLLDNFDDIARDAGKKKILGTSEGDVSFVSNGVYEISMPKYGVKKLVSSIEEAKAYIGGEWKSWSSLSDRIEAAGGILRNEGKSYVVHLAGTHYEAKTLSELASVLKDLPEPSVMPELVGADVSQYFKEGAPALDFQAFRPRYTVEPPKLENPNFLSRVSMLIKPMTPWVTDHARKTGAIDVLKTFNDMEAGSRIAFRDTDQMLELIDDMQRSIGGHTKKAFAKAEGILYYMGEPDAAVREGIASKFELGDKELAVVERLRAMLGKDPQDPTGLFSKFGMDPHTFLFNYMSRIRAATDDASILHLNQPEATERILEKAFGKGSIPNEIKYWAENMRQSDVIAFALDTNVFSVMRKYITRGNLKLFVGEPWRNMVALLKREGTDPDLRWRVFRYMDMLQGGGFTDGEKLMQSWSAALMKTLGFSKESQASAAHHDVLRTLYSVSYLTHLGWRPYVAIRNLAQMYQTVGPLLGNSYLKNSIQFIASEKGRDFILGLRKLGVLHRGPPIVNQLSNAEHILARISERGLAGFQTADEITRAVGYHAAMTKFNDGIRAFKTVNIDNARRFAEYVGSNLLGPEMNSRVLEAMMTGDPQKVLAGRHIFSNAMQERGLFLMRREQSPVMFHGVVGKMFGQYGTFAAQYVQFVAQTWKYATPAQKAAFAARWIGNSAALATGAYAIGLRGKDWLPWAPAQFTGGPFFNLAVDMLHSIGSDYQARQSRGELNRMLPIDLNKLVRGEGFELQPPVGLPGYYQIRTLMKMSEYASQGDPWKVFLAVLSAPIRSE